MHKPKILLLEDDANLNETICDYLEEQGYDVIGVYDGHEAENRLYENSYDLLLLDVNTPGINGFEVLKSAREQGVKTPAVYITSLGSVDDLEQGFESGCDDYIRKPFALKELLIRVDTLIKRSFYHEDRESISINEGISYDVPNGMLLTKDSSYQLGIKESKLLKLFLQRSDEVVSHESIFEVLWNYDEEPSDASLRTYIKNLRKVIGKERIISVKKQGYRYSSK
ncbi:MAG: response regulator transcription factor [Sulfurovum sp.]|nr:response regulator transcription factor [Sulfurovum sp.]